MGATDTLAPLFEALLGGSLPVRFEFWDGTALGPSDAGAAIVRLKSPEAVRHFVWAPGEIGLARAFVTGEVDVEGDLFEALRVLQRAAPGDLRAAGRTLPAALTVARRLGLLSRRPDVPAVEARPHGRLHSQSRDEAAVRHHYDVGEDFYRMVLGPSMTYSCAVWSGGAGSSLEDAQAAKHDLVCHKLGVDRREGVRMLDVGCGWGSLAMHAASRYGAQVVGITISEDQATTAMKRVADAGLGDRVEIRVQDYRDLRGETFDVVSSVGMSEHVGHARMATYFRTLRSVLARDGGRVLNHAISFAGGTKLGRRTFMRRYIFPDGELVDVADVARAMEDAGFEIRDVESLREHYALTLRAWVANLRGHWDAVVSLVGSERARAWLLYMAASVVGFEDGRLNVHQVLGVVAAADGASGVPLDRSHR